MTPHNPNIPGYAGNIYPWLEEVASPHIPHGGTYLEVGVFLGASLAHMGKLRPDIRLIAIDPWDGDGVSPEGDHTYQEIVRKHGGLFLAFLQFMMTEAPDVLSRTRILRGTVDTVRVLERVHVGFVDGAHDKLSVAKDLRAIDPLVLPGGIISGHDFDGFWPGVVEAVTDRYGQPQTRETCWWVER